MNNKITAIAVAAALAAPMAAQAAPKVYGIGQVEFAQTSNSATATTDKDYMVDNKFGRFGIKGSEDLGGGLKALYTFEFGLETTNTVKGSTTLFERETTIGMKIGKAHEIRMGNIKSPYKYMGGVKYDSFVATTLQARGGSTNVTGSGGVMSSGANGQGGFLQNSISYKGNFKPVRVWVSTSSLDNTSGDIGVTVLGVSAKVKSFEFGVVNLNRGSCLTTDTNCGTATSEYDATKFFGSWSKGSHAVRLQVEQTEDTPAAGGTSTDVDYTYLNYQFKMGKHLIDVAVGEKDDKRSTAGTDTDFTRLAYAYNFSKKTRVFAGIAESDNTNNVSGGTAANDWDTLSVGMTVKF